MLKSDMSGKTVIITAASRQPGRAIAKAFAENGAKLALCDADKNAVTEFANELSNMGYTAKGYELDILKPETFKGICEKIKSDLDSIDILINNEKDDLTGSDRKPTHLMDMDRYMTSVRKELYGTYYMGKTAMAYMEKGVVVNITSSLGLAPAANCMANVASSGAIMSLSRVSALEMTPHNIRVHCIARGSLDGYEYENSPTKEAIDHLATKRSITPEDVANAAIFCACDEAEYLNGEILTVDGGQHIGYMRNF